jgi:hypothetical protein
MMMEKIIVVAPTTAVPISTGFAVIRFEQVLGTLEVDRHIEVLLDLRFHVRHCLDQREFINRLRIVGNWAVRIHRDRYRAHTQESERDQSEREHGWSKHSGSQSQSHRAHPVGNSHQHHHGEAKVVAREIAGHKPRQDAKRCSAFFRGAHDFLHVTRLG